MPSHRWPSGRLLLGLAASVAVLESASYVAIAFLNQRIRPPIVRTPALYEVVRRGAEARLAQYETPYELDTLLGWRYTVSYHFGFHRLNAQGLRSAREYDTMPPAGTIRVAAFGDSSCTATRSRRPMPGPRASRPVFPASRCSTTACAATVMTRRSCDNRREGHALHPHMVMLGFIPDDLNRLVSVFRPFWTPEIPAFTKPRFVIGPGDSLRLVPSPIHGDADYRRLLSVPRRCAPSARWTAGTSPWSTPIRSTTGPPPSGSRRRYGSGSSARF